MGLFGAAAKGVNGTIKVGAALMGAGKRRDEERAAQLEHNQSKMAYANQDTSNLYKNAENVMEDLTVNTKQAEFVTSAQNQSIANTMGSMSAAAGGSGVAGLAQAMANQQATNIQKGSVSIGNQESANQTAAIGGAQTLQDNKIAWEQASRDAKGEIIETQFGMAQQRLGAAKQAKADAKQAVMDGVTQTVNAGGEFVDAMP